MLLALLAQAPQVAPPAALRPALRQLRNEFNDHRETFGATPALTTAKHQLRDWMESRLAAQGEGVDVQAFAAALNGALAGVDLFCKDFQDECATNLLGYVDDIRINRQGEFLAVVTATGISCGYDESAYVYAWDGKTWQRVWENEQDTYTKNDYLPQTIHDVLISSSDASRSRLLATLGSQASCGGSFKNLYARAWRMGADYKAEAVLNWTGYADDGYPPIQGRVLPDDVLFVYMAGGLAAGDPHAAIRHFTIGNGTATQVDPIAAEPRDFVVEWLSASWEESRTRSESASLEPLHAQLHRKDAIGDIPDPLLRCTTGSDVWQVATHFYEAPTKYYRLRWQRPYTFAMIGISDMPYPDCTVPDPGDASPGLLDTASPVR